MYALGLSDPLDPHALGAILGAEIPGGQQSGPTNRDETLRNRHAGKLTLLVRNSVLLLTLIVKAHLELDNTWRNG